MKDQIPSTRLNIDKIIRCDRAIMLHKILREKCLENPKEKFTHRTQILEYKTLSMNNLQIPKP